MIHQYSCVFVTSWVTLAETRRGGEREILAVVTQSDLSRSHVSWPGGGGGGEGYEG